MRHFKTKDISDSVDLDRRQRQLSRFGIRLLDFIYV